MEGRKLNRESNFGLQVSDLLKLYQLMVLTREFETRVAKIFRQQEHRRDPSFVHRGRGDRRGIVLRAEERRFCPSDPAGKIGLSHQRGPPSILMAGVFGKATGPSKGKWTAHHMGDLEKGILAGSLIIGSQFPTAVGAGLAFKLKKTDQVCLCFFGDGASNRGDFHEGLNMAAILKLPVIFICENNGYAVYTPVEQNMLIKDIALRAQGYGMPGTTIDGNDVLEVHQYGAGSGRKGQKRGRSRIDRMQDLSTPTPLREISGDPPPRGVGPLLGMMPYQTLPGGSL